MLTIYVLWNPWRASKVWLQTISYWLAFLLRFFTLTTLKTFFLNLSLRGKIKTILTMTTILLTFIIKRKLITIFVIFLPLLILFPNNQITLYTPWRQLKDTPHLWIDSMCRGLLGNNSVNFFKGWHTCRVHLKFICCPFTDISIK